MKQKSNNIKGVNLLDKKTTSWVSYITILGWIIAYLAGDKEGAKYYLNQSLVIWLGFLAVSLASIILAFIPILGWLAVFVANIYLVVMFVMGLINAIKQEEKELPLIGKIVILK